MSPTPKLRSEQVVRLTGATSAIGPATARRRAARGARLALVARDEGNPAELGSERAVAAPADLAGRDALRASADRSEEALGPIDTWINDAGVATYGAVTDAPWDDQHRLFETNYRGVVAGSLEALRRFGGRPGKLVTLGSALSDRAMIHQGPYSASKHAVKALTDTLRMVLRADVRPVSVTPTKPGAVHRPLWSTRAPTWTAVEPGTCRPPATPTSRTARSSTHTGTTCETSTSAWAAGPCPGWASSPPASPTSSRRPRAACCRSPGAGPARARGTTCTPPPARGRSAPTCRARPRAAPAAPRDGDEPIRHPRRRRRGGPPRRGAPGPARSLSRRGPPDPHGSRSPCHHPPRSEALAEPGPVAGNEVVPRTGRAWRVGASIGPWPELVRVSFADRRAKVRGLTRAWAAMRAMATGVRAGPRSVPPSQGRGHPRRGRGGRAADATSLPDLALDRGDDPKGRVRRDCMAVFAHDDAQADADAGGCRDPPVPTDRTSGSTVIAGSCAARASAAILWVATHRPSMRPATVGTNPPEQIERSGAPMP